MPETILTETGGLGPIRLRLPRDRLSVTPASRICVSTIGAHRRLLHGTGMDWGSGSGCMAIAAGLIPGVRRVVGVELDAGFVRLATGNAELNGVGDRVTFIEADGFHAADGHGARVLGELAGRCDFIVANPPASTGDDGLGFRRAVLAGAPGYLRDGALILMQVSYQYGARIPALADAEEGFTYEGVAGETDWEPFDLARPDLAQTLADYCAEEQRGGGSYRFRDPTGSRVITALQAVRIYERNGTSPLSRWQMHLFRFDRHRARGRSGVA